MTHSTPTAWRVPLAQAKSWARLGFVLVAAFLAASSWTGDRAALSTAPLATQELDKPVVSSFGERPSPAPSASPDNVDGRQGPLAGGAARSQPSAEVQPASNRESSPTRRAHAEGPADAPSKAPSEADALEPKPPQLWPECDDDFLRDPVRRIRAADQEASSGTPEELRRRLGFKWGASVEINPETGRPRQSSRLLDRTQGWFMAREATGGGGTLTVNMHALPHIQRPPSYRQGRRLAVEDLELAHQEALLRRLICDPLWLEREQMRMRRELWHHE